MGDKLEAVREFSRKLGEQFPKANWGGCCVVAALVAPELSKHFDSVKIRVQNSPWDARADVNVTEVANNLPRVHRSNKPWERNGVEFYHVYVEFQHGGRVYNFEAGGCYTHPPDCNPPLPGELPLKHARALAAWPSNWNRSFDRRDIPRLKTEVRGFFRALKSH